MRSENLETFELDLKAGELRTASRVVRLQGKPFQILVLLLENPGDVVTREEIRKKLWPEDTVIEFDHGIGTAVKKLRQALGDDATRPRYVETLARRGYRWMAREDWVKTKLASRFEADGTPVPSKKRRPNRKGNIESIAVLPFANLSSDQANEYFSDGLAEEILNALTRVPGLRVTARTSAFAFRGKEQDVRKIGETLGVGAILEGSVRRAGNRIRVAAQLIGTADGYHLWSEQYDRKMTDVFALQDEISQAIVGKLRAQLGGGKPTPVRRAANIEAYEAYLKGRFHYAKIFTKFTADALACAKASYEKAIALDARYAPAYSRLAMCSFAVSQLGPGPPREMMPQAKKAALKAVELDATDSEAHAVAGLVAAVFDYDWREALRQCQLALACDHVSPPARQLYAQFILLPLRRFDEAISVLEPLLSSDPLSPLPRKTLADAFTFRGDYPQAIEQLRRILELDDRFWLAHFALGNVYTLQGMTQKAISTYEQGLRIAGYPAMVGMLAGNYARAGEGARAKRTLARLARSSGAAGRAKALMWFCFVREELGRAADCLEELMEARDPDVVFVNCQPANVREYPRIRGLLLKMNLAEALR